MKTREAIAVAPLTAALALTAGLLTIFAMMNTPGAVAQGTAPTGTVEVTPPKLATPPAQAKPAAAKPAEPAKPGAAKSTDAAKVATGPRSIVGEVVDPACWIVNGARGDAHKECAIACAKAGQVLAILEKKSQKLYLVATDNPGDDPNKGLIDYVAQTVLVKGRVYTRGGATGIKVTSVEPYTAPKAGAE
ncbi:MAG: hypothetical protein HY568_01635 [Candidatus Latescibacteria bacterium]|nr:hypothetical protein [Candidatus Latescibacterota bacterium]